MFGGVSSVRSDGARAVEARGARVCRVHAQRRYAQRRRRRAVSAYSVARHRSTRAARYAA